MCQVWTFYKKIKGLCTLDSPMMSNGSLYNGHTTAWLCSTITSVYECIPIFTVSFVGIIQWFSWMYFQWLACTVSYGTHGREVCIAVLCSVPGRTGELSKCLHSFIISVTHSHPPGHFFIIFFLFRHGFARSNSEYGPLTDLPDWSFAGEFTYCM